MPEFPNPYSDEMHIEHLRVLEQHLATRATAIAKSLDIHFTEDEYDAVARVIGAVIRAHPWILHIPGVKRLLELE